MISAKSNNTQKNYFSLFSSIVLFAYVDAFVPVKPVRMVTFTLYIHVNICIIYTYTIRIWKQVPIHIFLVIYIYLMVLKIYITDFPYHMWLIHLFWQTLILMFSFHEMFITFYLLNLNKNTSFNNPKARICGFYNWSD